MAVFISGAVAGGLSWAAGYSLDTMKTIFQSQDLARPKISNYKELAEHVRKEHSIKSLNRGILMTANRGMFVGAISLVIWEKVLEMFEKRNNTIVIVN